MSEIIKAYNGRKLAHIVKLNDNYYYVDSALTECGYETMIFSYDIEKDDVISWTELYCQRYETIEEMEEQHKKICNEIEKYLKEDYGPIKFTLADTIAAIRFREENGND